jgi:hypothetical protein
VYYELPETACPQSRYCGGSCGSVARCTLTRSTRQAPDIVAPSGSPSVKSTVSGRVVVRTVLPGSTMVLRVPAASSVAIIVVSMTSLMVHTYAMQDQGGHALAERAVVHHEAVKRSTPLLPLGRRLCVRISCSPRWVGQVQPGSKRCRGLGDLGKRYLRHVWHWRRLREFDDR